MVSCSTYTLKSSVDDAAVVSTANVIVVTPSTLLGKVVVSLVLYDKEAPVDGSENKNNVLPLVTLVTSNKS